MTKRTPRKWTEAELDFLRANYRKLSFAEIGRHLGRTSTACRSKAGVLGIQESRAYTPDDIATVRRLYADHTAEEIAQITGRTKASIYGLANKLGLKTAPEFLRERGRINAEHPRAVAARLKKGHVPANKGKKMPPGWSPGRMAETQFRKGHKPPNWKPGIGHERITRDGYIEIKTRDGNSFKNYELKHRVIWKKKNGQIPKGHCVVFRDGNKLNCDISNLELITRAELARRNHSTNLPPEVRKMIATLGGFRRRLNNYAKKQDRRSAEPAVRNDGTSA